MASRSNFDMYLDEGLKRPSGNLEDTMQNELELLLMGQRNQSIIERERDLNIYRSGSAPPTVEGSLSAVGSLFGNSDFREINVSSSNHNAVLSDDDIRSHPAYLSYYYSHDIMNPRLPPPLLSKEDWRVAQRVQTNGPALGGIGDWRKKLVDGGNTSLLSMQPGISIPQQEPESRNFSGRSLSRQASYEWQNKGSDSLSGFMDSGLGARSKSFADILQEGLSRPASVLGQSSRPTSRNAFGDTTIIADAKVARLNNGVELDLHDGAALPGLIRFQSQDRTISHSFSSAVGSSLSRSTTPEPQLVGRSPSPGLPPVGSRICPVEKKNVTGSGVQDGHRHSFGVIELPDIAANFSGLSLSNRHSSDESHVPSQLDIDNQSNLLFNIPDGRTHMLQQQFIENSIDQKLLFSSDYVDLARTNGHLSSVNVSKITSNERVNLPRRSSSSASLYSKLSSSGLGSLEDSNIYRQNANAPATNNQLDAGYPLVMGPSNTNFLPAIPDYATSARSSLSHTSEFPNNFGISQGDLEGLRKAYLEALLTEKKQQYELSLLGTSGGYNHKYHKNPSYGHGTPYLGDQISNSGLSAVKSGGPMLQNERMVHFNSMTRNLIGESFGLWPSDIGSNMEGRFVSSLLDEFKSNKCRSFELADISGHVVEFSMDQYGSRFIQQKLETATVEEKTIIFPEIIPHARTLMTDVFGNYVIQKFFEHGTESERRELASLVTGHVLPLSLQMYGCRVIQKALEVVDVDQQTQMVAELDGSVMKCVRDQNGNHVIQKCIECVPQDRIQFIITAFYGQVVALSTHPYGCRVIQRVLEHCDDMNTQQIIMDEVMQSVCSLSQDQYGNYVIQHILEHGKPDERSVIITKLAGQIVNMSQQKFASNVVEKCLTFGSPEQRQLLMNEILGSTDENEPLQAMMKDPFGNYVVQKVLETCDDRNLELILSRIRVHLTSLKRYTYGKHVVSRIEKLITAGERRIGRASSLSSQGIVPT